MRELPEKTNRLRSLRSTIHHIICLPVLLPLNIICYAESYSTLFLAGYLGELGKKAVTVNETEKKVSSSTEIKQQTSGPYPN